MSTYDSTVNSFYLAFYGRPADPAGLTFWSTQLAANNGDLGAITQAFATSEEAQVRFGTDSTAERISEIYQQLFNRAPEATGLAYWTDVIGKGHASLADVAIEILNGAQGSDARLSALRQQAADAFTAQVEASGSDYSGYAAVEAARILVRAVTPGATQADLDTLVAAAVSFADTATKTPQVVEAIAVNTTLLALFDSARGVKEPVALAKALADTAKAAAGDPVTLESLLRGGGMDKVLKVMPAKATLKDVVDALAKGGLPAAVDVVYPTKPAPAPEPAGVSIAFVSVDQGPDDSKDDHITNKRIVDVKFEYSGTLRQGQSFEYSIDGQPWQPINAVGNTITIAHVDLIEGKPENAASSGMGIMDFIGDLATNVSVQVVDAAKNPVTSATQKIVWDTTEPDGSLSFVRLQGEADGVLETSQDQVNAVFNVSGLTDGIPQWRIAGQDEWTDATQVVNGNFVIFGIDLRSVDPTVEVRVIDAAGNVGDTMVRTIDGPFISGVTAKATVAGLEVTSATAGMLTLNRVEVISDHDSGGAIVGTVTLGEQGWSRGGTLAVEIDEQVVLDDKSGIIYRLGTANSEMLNGSYLWGFGGSDILTGTNGDDFISGGDGNDTIYSMGGSDIISGGKEADGIYLVKDGKGSTLVYEKGDTFVGQFIDNTYISGQDRIHGAEAGDAIQVGDIFGGVPVTVSTQLLTTQAMGQAAIVRGALEQSGARFVASNSGTAYMVQWTDAQGINSILLNDFDGIAGLEVDRATGTMKLVDTSVQSNLFAVGYHLYPNQSFFMLMGSPASVIEANTANGLLDTSGFALVDMRTNGPSAGGYLDSPHFRVEDNFLYFNGVLKTGAYEMSWGDHNFATATGRLAADEVMFAGGYNGRVLQEGFTITDYTMLNGSPVVAADGTSTLYRALADTATDLVTGAGKDAILAGEGTVNVIYNTLSSASQDLILNFGVDDMIKFGGAAEALIDKDEDGQVAWAPGIGKVVATSSTEAAYVITNGAINSYDVNLPGSLTLLTLNNGLDVSGLSVGDSLLIMAADSDGSAGALFHFTEKGGSNKIDADELVLVATFSDGLPSMAQITVVGTYDGGHP